MSVNGIQTTAYQSYATEGYGSTSKAKKTDDVKASEVASEKAASKDGVVYEKSSKMSASDRAALVQKLKAETESRVSQFKSLVENLFTKQGQKITDSDSMWKMLADGNFTVDKETAQKAKEEISEDGYWGVNQTSDRIFEMAKALSGGDEGKMGKMLDAFKKGFDAATKAWGKDLPDISHKTYDAVMEKFQNYKAEE